MKTAISLPDELYQRAETTARKMRISRSRLYSRAIAEFLEKEEDSAVTERLNTVYAEQSSVLDPSLERAQLVSLGRDDWQK